MRRRRRRLSLAERLELLPKDDGLVQLDGLLFSPKQVKSFAKATMLWFDELPLEERRQQYDSDC